MLYVAGVLSHYHYVSHLALSHAMSDSSAASSTVQARNTILVHLIEMCKMFEFLRQVVTLLNKLTVVF